MPFVVSCEYVVEQAAPAEATVVALVTAALTGEPVPDDAEVSVLFTDDVAVQALNHEYRGIDAPTDVLSFGLTELAVPANGEPFAAEDFILPPDSGTPLGEVIISHETALRQAMQHGRAVEHELAHLVVHGVLHLLGYDHAAADDERRMRDREDAVLQACGFPPGSAGWSH